MKRSPANSAEGAIKAMVNAALPDLHVPEHISLSPEALKFWPGILHARARDEWRDLDLVVAAQLAACQAMIENESCLLRDEGTIQENDRGTMIENPRNRVIHSLALREMALMRTLLMSGKAAPDPRSLAGPRMVEGAARKAQQEMQEDELLAS